MSNNGSTALVANNDKQRTLKDMLERSKQSLAAVLPKHVTPERMVKVALSATARTPFLLKCTPVSIVKAVMQGAELGLEAGGLLGEGYIVPFRNHKTGEYEAQFIPGYRGFIKLARNSGQILSIEAHVVHKDDQFEVEFGLHPKLVHRPAMKPAPGEVVCAYAIAHLKDGSHQVEVMTITQLEAIRSRSKASDSGPWVTDTEEMFRKTVVRRLAKYLPLSPELHRALEVDAEADTAGHVIDVELVNEAPAAEAEAKPAIGSKRTKAIKDKLAGNGAPPEDEPDIEVDPETGEVVPPMREPGDEPDEGRR